MASSSFKNEIDLDSTPTLEVEVPTFKIGERFENFNLFNNKLQARLDQTKEKLIKGIGNKKLKSNAKTRCDDMVYQSVDYVCKYGGSYQSRAKGKGRL